jgi:invasion protein IalB
MKGRLLSAALSAYLVLCTQTVFAQAPSENQFEDWRVSCRETETGRHCQLSQAVPLVEDGQAVVLLSVSRDEKTGQSYAVATTPAEVYLAPGIEIRVDGGRPFKVLYEFCNANGCYAGFKLSENVLRAFRRGIEAKVRVWAGKTKAVDLPISLRGFTAAFRHYQAEMSP